MGESKGGGGVSEPVFLVGVGGAAGTVLRHETPAGPEP